MKVITIGRSKDYNDIVVDDVKVSRNHLQMIMDDQGHYSVLDLNSANGTFVNGKRITGEVPLQVTDELKIGDTVLSWQNFFDGSANMGEGAPVPPSQTYPPQSPVSNPSPKRWWIYAIIGAAVLLLAIGGGVGWKIYRDKQQKTELLEKRIQDEQTEREKQKALDDAKTAAEKAAKEYAEAMQKAAETQSKEDLAYAEKMRKKMENAEKNVLDKEQELKILQQELSKEKENVSKANKRADDEAKAKKIEEEKAIKAGEQVKSAERSKDVAELETKLTREFYGLLMNANDLQAKQVCKVFDWPIVRGEIKGVIRDNFDKADNTKKEQIIASLKSALKTVVEENVENDTPTSQSQKKAEGAKKAETEPQIETSN